MVYQGSTWQARMEEKGNQIVTLIQAYKASYGHYPKDLTLLGMTANDREGYNYKGENFYYDRMDDGTFQLYYARDAEHNTVYNSLIGTWMDDFYPDLTIEKKALLLQHINELYTDGQIESTTYDSVNANTKRIKPKGFSSLPDSSAYQRDYDTNGNMVGEGWIVFYKDREDDGTTRVGTWKYYTQDHVLIEVNYGSGNAEPSISPSLK